MNLKTLISEDELNKRIKDLAMQISNDYQSEEIVVVCILTGAVYFTVDLTKYIDSNKVRLEFMKVSSYGNGFESSGKLEIQKDLSIDIEGKNVLIVEDIIDSGLTMHTLKEMLLKRNPKSLRICTLLDKKERRKVKIDADYVGFSIPNKFVLGYGLDYEEYYRNLPYIAYKEG